MSAIAGMPPGLLRFLGDMHGHSRRLAARIVSVGALAGAFEATALLLFMDAVLRIAVTGESSENIGPIAWSASPTATLGISAVFIVAAALLHGLMAKLTTDGSLVVLAHAQQRILRSTLGARWSHQADAADGSMLTAVTYLATAASYSQLRWCRFSCCSVRQVDTRAVVHGPRSTRSPIFTRRSQHRNPWGLRFRLSGFRSNSSPRSMTTLAQLSGHKIRVGSPPA